MMTETMPAFGAERNLSLALLLGWRVEPMPSKRPYDHALCNPAGDAIAYGVGDWIGYCIHVNAVPDYCGDNGDCFGLLVTLQKLPVVREIALRYIDETVCVKISTDLLNYSDGWTYDACEQSTLPGECGWRDAITQAAWEALSAAKETE